ncbi:hypothetical protein ACFPIF_11275 [Brevundimonas faecalis]|uniref:hypothetical protein n=1 Tax=Brevundimonas faecalis TaxID=947378 RepID=UPI003606F4E7
MNRRSFEIDRRGVGRYHPCMLRVYCDFNELSEDGLYWLLFYNQRALADVVADLGLREGDRVLLYQDVDDFEVEASLHLNRSSLFFPSMRLGASPDWTTRREIQGPQGGATGPC